MRLARLVLLAVSAMLASAGVARADFLNLSSVTSGTAGSFSGTLDGIPVTGLLSSPTGTFVLNAVGAATSWETSTIDDSSPQYGHSATYTPSDPATDRVGFTYRFPFGSVGATLTISFGSPIANPVFHIANLDGVFFDFAPTVGLVSLALLSGNGGGGDGLIVSGLTMRDANPNTLVGLNPATPPPSVGPRSAYGSVQLNGVLSGVTIALTPQQGISTGDGGSFTLSTPVPEPGTLVLLTSGLGLCVARRLRRRRGSAGCD